MIGLPESTQFNIKIPKRTLYENIKVSTALKRVFVEQIQSIVWSNKISVDTLSVKQGKCVEEIQVIELHLYKKELDYSVLNLIKNGIPYRIVFVLTCDRECMLVAYHGKMFCTEWMPVEKSILSLNGSNLDDIWDGFVQQIGNITISDGRTLDEQIEENERVAKLKKEIEKLERMAKKEVQPKRKFELHQEILRLKNEL